MQLFMLSSKAWQDHLHLSVAVDTVGTVRDKTTATARSGEKLFENSCSEEEKNGNYGMHDLYLGVVT